MTDTPTQRPPAEIRYADELNRLAADDDGPRPKGWRLSAAAVRRFVLGDPERGIVMKYVGNPSLVDRAMVALATQRALLLVGEPGTAKSLLSELLCAAICGDSTLVIQGGAATTEDQIRYSWNYALLLNRGPTRESLVPAPLYTAMETGRIVRFEEITRCPQEVQDCLLSVLSDRVLAVPELDDSPMLYAREGFNLIATANTRDRGVNEMSAALKRRLNFETVFPIADRDTELALVKQEATRQLAAAGVPAPPEDDLLEVLVRTFRDLRGTGETGDTHRLSTVMSTAEAVGVAVALGVTGHFVRGRAPDAGDLLECMAGTAVKDDPEDLARLRRYLDHVAAKRTGTLWRDLHAARTRLPS
jgi:MoxR-like ATPase